MESIQMSDVGEIVLGGAVGCVVGIMAMGFYLTHDNASNSETTQREFMDYQHTLLKDKRYVTDTSAMIKVSSTGDTTYSDMIDTTAIVLPYSPEVAEWNRKFSPKAEVK